MAQPVDPIASFHIDPDSTCVCGRARKFKACCGSEEADRPPPHGVIHKPAFLPAQVCEQLLDYAKRQSRAELAVVTEERVGIGESINTDRVSTRVDLGEKQQVIDDWIERIFTQFLAKRLKRKVIEHTQPDLMCYTAGGYYKPHADSEIFDGKTGQWKKVLERDYSLLLYLNDDFVGGALHFHHFNYTYQPQQGDLLLFPSDNRYLHEAQRTASGERYVIVSWATLSVPRGRVR